MSLIIIILGGFVCILFELSSINENLKSIDRSLGSLNRHFNPLLPLGKSGPLDNVKDIDRSLGFILDRLDDIQRNTRTEWPKHPI